MENRHSRLSVLAILACMFMILACAFAVPARAMAEEATVVAHSIDSAGQRTDYTDVGSAIESGYAGATIVMDTDWDFGSGYFRVIGGKSLTVDMNGHKITSTSISTIEVLDKATLKLTSSAVASDFSYRGYAKTGGDITSQTWDWQDLTVSAGGLVTNDKKDYFGFGISVGDDARLQLENIAVAGCFSEGIDVGYVSTVDLTNAVVCHNAAGTAPSSAHGGGVHFSFGGSTLNMDNSHIDDNYAQNNGGGVFSPGDTTITMANGSTISRNAAGEAGGGIYCSGGGFTIKSQDGTGVIGENACLNTNSASRNAYLSGGGIHLNATKGTNNGLIEDVTIKGNYSGYDGGGVELDQESTRLVNCKIIGNSARCDGGGVFVYNDYNSIEGCEIRDNYCAAKGGNYEGGGVFVSYHYDIKMSGACIAEGNTRGQGSGNADDVFLSTLSGGGGKAYITGSLSKGSTVGVRTGIEGDRRVAKSFTPETKDCLFYDLDGYYISYGSDEGGDAWQRHSSPEFSVTVDGKQVGTYKQGAAVSVNGGSDSSKAFKCWNAEKSTSNIFTDETKWNQSLSFTMPQHDVVLAGDYLARSRDVSASLFAPEPGKELSSKGSFLWKWIDDEGEQQFDTIDVDLAWCEKKSDGSLSPATGTAKEGAVYIAYLSVSQNVRENRAFAFDLEASEVEVLLTDGTNLGAAEVHVDASGTLSITTNPYETAGATVTEVEPLSISFEEGTSESEFMKQFPKSTTALTSSGSVVNLDFKWPQDCSSLFDDAGNLKKPSPNPITLYVELEDPEEVVLPESLRFCTVALTVTDSGKPSVADPTVSPDQGTYSTDRDADRFVDGSLRLTASCSTDGASIKYSLSHLEDGEWKEDCAGKDYGSSIDLPVPDAAGGQRSYQLIVWAEKDGISSNVRTFLYTVKNAAQPKMATVTVEYADTAVDGRHGAKDSEPYEVKQGAALTVSAPYRPGYVFEKWLDSDGAVLGTDAALSFSAVNADMTVTALYNPVVSDLDIDFAAPMAHEALDNAGTVKAKAGDSDDAFDVTDWFVGEEGKAGVAWLPEGDAEGKAEHMANYIAALTFGSSWTSSGVKYVFPSGIKIRYKGSDPIDSSSAYIAQDTEGVDRLCLVFPNTGPLEVPVFEHSFAVDLTYEQAWDYQTAQDAGRSETWDLPKEVLATCKCGCTVDLDIAWDKVEGFDKSKLEAQELTVKGKVAFPDYVDPQDDQGQLVSDEVSVTVKVAAPESVAGPETSLAPGSYHGTQQMYFSCATADATIRYTIDGSEPDENSPIYDGTAVEIAHSATVKAKAFRDGWASSNVVEFAYTITHTVSFDAAGGSAVDAQEIEDGECAIEPSAPSMEGCDFKGWYLADGARYNFTEPVTEDVMLYARWSKKGEPLLSHIVMFDTAGGSEVVSQTVADGECAVRPDTDPTRDGYTFAGWYADSLFTSEFDFEAPITADVTVYAKWVKDDGGSGGGEDGDGEDRSQGDAATASDQDDKDGSAIPATGDSPMALALAASVVCSLALAVRARKRFKGLSR